MEDVAKAHLADLKTQVGRDVRYLRYWVAEDNGRVFCLVEAPSARGGRRRPPGRPRPGRGAHLPGPGRRVVRRTHDHEAPDVIEEVDSTMRTKRIAKYGARADRGAGAGGVDAPRMGRLRRRAEGEARGQARTRSWSSSWPRRALATAKYATQPGPAKQDGYGIITQMIPNMGYHFMNPSITGFDVTKPPILVYEHTATDTWQLGALEWVFTSMPKDAAAAERDVRVLPGRVSLQGRHVHPGRGPEHVSEDGTPTRAPEFNFWHPDLVTMHVWIWYPNPAGSVLGHQPAGRSVQRELIPDDASRSATWAGPPFRGAGPSPVYSTVTLYGTGKCVPSGNSTRITIVCSPSLSGGRMYRKPFVMDLVGPPGAPQMLSSGKSMTGRARGTSSRASARHAHRRS